MSYVACAVLLVSVVASFSSVRRDLDNHQKTHLHLIAIVSALWAIFTLLFIIATK